MYRIRRRATKLARFYFPPLVGPFGFQKNNDTRLFEYPWAFLATPLHAGMRAIELGGSLAGFQFTLSKCGVKVTNVDPGDEAAIGWPVSQEMIGRLNRFFHTDVELVSSRLEESGLEEASFDRVVSISTIEHIPREELPAILSEVKRLLKPGGMFILTVDLFLDLYPFTNADSNRLGHNISISDIVLWSGLDLVQGNRQELYGFEEFDAKEILRKLPEYLYGSGYPSLAQALVLQKKV